LLAPDSKPGDQRPVPLDIVVLHVVEQAAPTPDELHQTPPGVVISPVDLEMVREKIDASREERHLHFWRAGVGLVKPVLDDRGRLVRHALVACFLAVPAGHAGTAGKKEG